MFREVKECRICKNPHLTQVLDLGEQMLTGRFPKAKSEQVPSMPLQLVKCAEDGSYPGACGLLQLRHSGEMSELYGHDYGYRSGLNASMVAHLHNKVERILKFVSLSAGDLVIDIGSNDSTLLQSYPSHENLMLVGIDPTGDKFRSYYPAHIQLIPDFFSREAVQKKFGAGKKAKIVTSISMFYDLDSPTDFMRQVHEVLDDEGVWVFEQSYMPTMLKMNSYDTVCHEHLEYYAFKQIKWMADQVGFKIIDVEFNAVNGGSFSITAARKTSQLKANDALVAEILEQERTLGLNTLRPYLEFETRVAEHRHHLRAFLEKARKEGKKVLAYGASTKGNVILQYCGLTERDLAFVAEVNQEKFGCYTPGTLIPIVSEKEAKAMKPDYFLVFPWHFKENILMREKEYLAAGGKLLFPLPSMEVV